MTCRTVDFGNGITAIVCDRGRKPAKCTACKERPHTRLCDFPLKGDRAGKTCSVRLCDRCAVRVADNVDLCPPHARVDRGEALDVTIVGGGRATRAVMPNDEVRSWVRSELEREVRAWCEDRFVDVDEVLEFWEERAAIRQFDGGTPKWAAEELAFREDVVGKFGP